MDFRVCEGADLAGGDRHYYVPPALPRTVRHLSRGLASKKRTQKLCGTLLIGLAFKVNRAQIFE